MGRVSVVLIVQVESLYLMIISRICHSPLFSICFVCYFRQTTISHLTSFMNMNICCCWMLLYDSLENLLHFCKIIIFALKKKKLSKMFFCFTFCSVTSTVSVQSACIAWANMSLYFFILKLLFNWLLLARDANS